MEKVTTGIPLTPVKEELSQPHTPRDGTPTQRRKGESSTPTTQTFASRRNLFPLPAPESKITRYASTFATSLPFLGFTAYVIYLGVTDPSNTKPLITNSVAAAVFLLYTAKELKQACKNRSYVPLPDESLAPSRAHSSSRMDVETGKEMDRDGSLTAALLDVERTLKDPNHALGELAPSMDKAAIAAWGNIRTFVAAFRQRDKNVTALETSLKTSLTTVVESLNHTITRTVPKDQDRETFFGPLDSPILPGTKIGTATTAWNALDEALQKLEKIKMHNLTNEVAATSKDQILSLTSQLETRGASLKREQEAVSRLRAELTSREQEKTTLLGQLAEAEKARGTASTAQALLAEKVKEKETDMVALAEKNNKLLERLKKADVALTDASGERNDLALQVQDKVNAITAFSKEKANLTKELTQLRADLEKASTKTKTLEQTLREQAESLKKFTETTKKLREQLDKSLEMAEQLETEKATLGNKVSDLTKKNADHLAMVERVLKTVSDYNKGKPVDPIPLERLPVGNPWYEFAVALNLTTTPPGGRDAPTQPPKTSSSSSSSSAPSFALSGPSPVKKKDDSDVDD